MTVNKSENAKKQKRTLMWITVSLVFLGFCAFMKDRVFGNIAQTDEESVGYFYNSLRDVRKKSPNGLAWIKASNKDLLSNGDVVTTGDMSQAILKIKNGQDIYIYDNSFVLFRLGEEGKIVLDVKYGVIKLGKTVSDILINNCGREIIVLKGDNSFSINKDKNCQDLVFTSDSPEVTKAPNEAEVEEQSKTIL